MAIEKLYFFDLKDFKDDLSALLPDGDEIRFGKKTSGRNSFSIPLFVYGLDNYHDWVVKANGYLGALQEEYERTDRIYERVEFGNHREWKLKGDLVLPKSRVAVGRYLREDEVGFEESRVDHKYIPGWFKLKRWEEADFSQQIPTELFPTPWD